MGVRRNTPKNTLDFSNLGSKIKVEPLGPLGFDFAQHRQTLRPTVDGTRSKALRPFGDINMTFWALFENPNRAEAGFYVGTEFTIRNSKVA